MPLPSIRASVPGASVVSRQDGVEREDVGTPGAQPSRRGALRSVEGVAPLSARMRSDTGGVSADESRRLLVSAPEPRAARATIDTGTAVASGVVLATTAGTGSLDRYACELARRLDVRTVEIDGYVRTGDLFGVPLLSRRSLQLLVADLDHVRLLRGASGRLVHFPHHHLARYGRFLSRPYVVTVHDLIRFFDLKRLGVFIRRPNLRDRLLLRLDYAGVAGATALIAVSETTKRDLVRHLGVPEERIFVVHEGIDHARFRPVERRLLNERYVLFVGSEHPRKNLAAVLRAFAALKRERRLSDLKLVKVGGPGGSEAPFRARTLALVRELGLDDDVLFTEHVPDEDLSAWYSGAPRLAIAVRRFWFPAA